MKRLPPLSTLPVLEAAARLESFSAAAEELHVTHGAVSHQIRSLENHLGVAMFVRTGRRVVLTPEGGALAQQVRTALKQLADAVESVSPAAREHRLTISTVPSFASRWLMPRISEFLNTHPEYIVSVEATQSRSNFTTDGVDVAIRYGQPPWPGVHHEFIGGDMYFTVCSPNFRRGRLPTEPAHLESLPLFHTETGMWERWFAKAGLTGTPKVTGVQFNDASMNLQMAIEGKGIALTRRSLAATDIAEGRLVKLFDIEVEANSGYYLVCLEQHAKHRKIVEFRDWLMSRVDWAQAPQDRKAAMPRKRAAGKTGTRR